MVLFSTRILSKLLMLLGIFSFINLLFSFSLVKSTVLLIRKNVWVIFEMLHLSDCYLKHSVSNKNADFREGRKGLVWRRDSIKGGGEILISEAKTSFTLIGKEFHAYSFKIPM